jgi:UDP-glucose 4-epimerase
MEKMMKWFDSAHGIKYVSLRYFNAAGARCGGQIGEDHTPETHLIPIILQVALGQRGHISIFGEDYATPDGTCVRDYIHVSDLADAHVLAVEKLRQGADSSIYNLGNGKGFSVKEVVEIARKVTGHEIPAVIEPRRGGDPAELIASSDRASRELGWKPSRDSLKAIIESAWKWHQSHPQGYKK